jgi:vitamin B12 transporter
MVYDVSAQVKQDTLNEVKIISTKITEENISVTPVQIIHPSALDKLNSTTVADAVKIFSGVQLKDYGGIGGLKTINVRSLGSNHSGIFFDGIPITNTQNGEIDLGKYALENIESLALYNGQSDQIFQPASAFASASALLLKPRNPVFNEGEKSHLNVGFRTGSFGLVNPFMFWQHKVSQRLSGSVSAGWQKAHGRYKFHYINGDRDSLVKRTNSDIDALRLEAGLYGVFRDSSSWSLKMYNYQSDRGLPGAVIANRINAADRLKERDFFVQSAYERRSGNYQLMFKSKFAHNYTRYLNPQYLNAEGGLDNRYRQNTLFFSLANQYRIKPYWNIALSVDYFRNNLDANLYQFVFPFRQTGLMALATELKFKRINLQSSLLYTAVNERIRSGTSAFHRQQFSPSFALSWQPLAESNLRLRVFYKDIFRLPTFNDLYYTLIGNSALQPEFAKQYNMGLTYTKAFKGNLQYFTFHADAYHNKIKDKITAIPTANLFRWSMVNMGKVRINGLDAGMQTAINLKNDVNVSLNLNYTFQDAVDITPDSYYYNKQIPYTPKHSGSALLGLAFNKWAINYNLNYNDIRYSQQENISENLMPAWVVADLNTSYKFSFNKTEFKIVGEINNIGNKPYTVVYNYPMPGRSFRLTLNMNF